MKPKHPLLLFLVLALLAPHAVWAANQAASLAANGTVALTPDTPAGFTVPAVPPAAVLTPTMAEAPTSVDTAAWWTGSA